MVVCYRKKKQYDEGETGVESGEKKKLRRVSYHRKKVYNKNQPGVWKKETNELGNCIRTEFIWGKISVKGAKGNNMREIANKCYCWGRVAIVSAPWPLSTGRGRPVHYERRWPGWRHLGHVRPLIATGWRRTGRTTRVRGHRMVAPGNSILNSAIFR